MHTPNPSPLGLGAFEATLAELEESSNVSLSIFHTGTDDAGGTGSEPLPKGQLFKGRPNFYDLLAPKRTDGVVGVYVDTATTAITAVRHRCHRLRGCYWSHCRRRRR